LKSGQLILLYRGPKSEPTGAVIDGVDFRLAGRKVSNRSFVYYWLLPSDEKALGDPALGSLQPTPVRKAESSSWPMSARNPPTPTASVLPAARTAEAARPPSPVGPDIAEWPVAVNENATVGFYPVSEAEKAMIKARNYRHSGTAGGVLLGPGTEMRRILSAGNSAFAVSMPDGTLYWLALASNQSGLVSIEDYRDRMHRE